jgi:glycosyltransferase involved in cell wall biosynthesis
MTESERIPASENSSSPKVKMDKLEPPNKEEIKAFFTNAISENGCKWREYSKVIEGQGIYFIRLREGEAVRRWMGKDDYRILYIGQSIRERRNHQAIKNLATLATYCGKLKDKVPPSKCQYLLVKEKDDLQRSRWESFLLVSYHFYFADRPPLNRNLPKVYRQKEYRRVAEGVGIAKSRLAKDWEERCGQGWTEIAECLKELAN